jgi:hypothetical protein
MKLQLAEKICSLCEQRGRKTVYGHTKTRAGQPTHGFCPACMEELGPSFGVTNGKKDESARIDEETLHLFDGTADLREYEQFLAA